MIVKSFCFCCRVLLKIPSFYSPVKFTFTTSSGRSKKETQRFIEDGEALQPPQKLGNFFILRFSMKNIFTKIHYDETFGGKIDHS